MNDSNIRWTGKTWNPVSGCKQITTGCAFCYAKTLAERYGTSKAFPNQFDLTLRPHKLGEPFSVKKPSIIFVNSMSDLFWDEIPDDYRHRIIDVIEQTPQHEYQVLTKRPEAMLAWSRRRKLPPNFWAGVTIEEERYTDRADVLRRVDAEIRFISAEPLISSLHLNLEGIAWVITGGESGNHLVDDVTCARRGLVYRDMATKRWFPRPDKIEWVRKIRDDCTSNGVAFFHKQWGGPRPTSAGHLLDGKEWSQYPRLPKSSNALTEAPSFL